MGEKFNRCYQGANSRAEKMAKTAVPVAAT